MDKTPLARSAITEASQDLLGTAPGWAVAGRQMRELAATRGLVVAVHGAPGSGRSSAAGIMMQAMATEDKKRMGTASTLSAKPPCAIYTIAAMSAEDIVDAVETEFVRDDVRLPQGTASERMRAALLAEHPGEASSATCALTVDGLDDWAAKDVARLLVELDGDRKPATIWIVAVERAHAASGFGKDRARGTNELTRIIDLNVTTRRPTPSERAAIIAEQIVAPMLEREANAQSNTANIVPTHNTNDDTLDMEAPAQWWDRITESVLAGATRTLRDIAALGEAIEHETARHPDTPVQVNAMRCAAELFAPEVADALARFEFDEKESDEAGDAIRAAKLDAALARAMNAVHRELLWGHDRRHAKEHREANKAT